MKKQLNFKLIDGTFSLEDAADILRTLIRAKIQHHRASQFSLEERFGVDHLNSAKRVEELKASLAQVETYLAQPELADCEIELQSEVKATICSPVA